MWKVEKIKRRSKVIFNSKSKVVHNCIGFVLLCSVIGPENSRNYLDQPDAKLETIATCSHTFWEHFSIENGATKIKVATTANQ